MQKTHHLPLSQEEYYLLYGLFYDVLTGIQTPEEDEPLFLKSNPELRFYRANKEDHIFYRLYSKLQEMHLCFDTAVSSKRAEAEVSR